MELILGDYIRYLFIKIIFLYIRMNIVLRIGNNIFI